MIQAIVDCRALRGLLLIAAGLAAQFFAAPAALADTDCTSNFGNSGIAWTGESVVIVASTNMVGGGNLYYFWQKTGTGNWHRELVAEANGGTCPGNCTGWCQLTPWGYLSNAIAWTGDSVIIAAVDQRDGGLYYWWQARGTQPWHQQQIAQGPPGCCQFGNVINGQVNPEILGYVPPSIAWTGKSVVVTACDRKENLHYWFQEKFKTTWYHELVAPTGGCVGEPSIAWTGTTVIIAASCNVGLCYYWQPAGAGGWNREVVDSAPSASPSIGWNGKAVIISAVAYPTEATSTVNYFWQAAGTRPWHKQQVMAPTSNAWGIASIAAADDSVLIAAAASPEQPMQNTLNFWWEPFASNGAWILQTPGGASNDYTVWTDTRSLAWTGVSAIMSAVTPCGDLHYWWQKKGSTSWNLQRVVTNPGWPPGTC